MKILAELLQRTLGGGADGGYFSGTARHVVSLPMVYGFGRLGVVSSIPAGDFCFCFQFLANLLFFWADGRAARDFGPPKTAMVGHIYIFIGL